MAKALGTTFAIVFVSTEISKAINATAAPAIIKGIFGSKYLLLTTITCILATAFPKFLGEIRGAQEIGTFMIYIFFVVIGAPADLKVILLQSPILLVFCLIIVCVNMAVTFSVGKLFKFNVEELCIASNANVGGPTTAAAMAIAKGWEDLVLPAMLVGVYGYVIGNYIGLFVGTWLATIF